MGGGSHLRRLLRGGMGAKTTKALRALGKLGCDFASPVCGLAGGVRSAVDAGRASHWKSHDFADLSDGAIGAMLSAVRAAGCECSLRFIGGWRAFRPTPRPGRSRGHFVMVPMRAGATRPTTAPVSPWARGSRDGALSLWAASMSISCQRTSRPSGTAYGADYRRL